MIKNIILSNLVYNEEYMRKVLPYLKDEYFNDNPNQLYVFKTIVNYVNKYNRLPTKEVLLLKLEEDNKVNDKMMEEVANIINNLATETQDLEWLIDETEKFCQETSIINAIRESIQIIDSDDKTIDKGMIPHMLSDALGVSFDNHIGHDFMNDADERFEFYHRKEEKVPFDLEMFNKITKGGVARKALIVAMASTGVGKTIFMCHCAAANLMEGRNVLYITLEMAEERIAERIDANILDIPLEELTRMPKETYLDKIDRAKKKTTGKLVIKEYYTSSAHVGHFRHLINELKMKKNFVPDIIYIDYLNICASSRFKTMNGVNSYSYIKSIAEEIRGLAGEFNVPIFSATQTNRNGFSNSDIELTETSESIGLTYTVDMMFALMSTEELESVNKLLVKQLKNRWADINKWKKFTIGIDRSRMKLYDVDQGNESENTPSQKSNINNETETDKLSFDRVNKSKPSFRGFV